MSTANELAAAYDKAWVGGDAEALNGILAADVTFSGPFAQVSGKESCVAGLVEMAKMLTGAETKVVLADDDNALIWSTFSTKEAPATPTATWLQIADGRISRIQTVFDASGSR